MAQVENRPDWHLATLKRYRLFMDDLIVRFGSVCVHCGATERLQFDHVDWRTKYFSIATNWAMKDRNAFELELLKCQLLCSPCHDTKTESDKQEMGLTGYTHGTVYAWMKCKCECKVCDAAKQKWNEERRVKRRSNEGRGAYNLPAEHGTTKRYKRGCKCDECKAANSRAVQGYKEAKRLRESVPE